VRRAAGDAAQGLVRSHASEYHLDPRRIGVSGFSAGGHLAAQTATHFDAGSPAAQDTIERASGRPDFAILSYPVIGSLGGGAKWSFQNILGRDPSPKQIEELSPDLQVTGKPQQPLLCRPTMMDVGLSSYAASG